MEQRREHYKIRHANILIGVMSGSLWLMIAMGIASLTTGCSGLEARAGIYKVDTRSTQEMTATSHPQPLKCWFVDCARVETSEMGS